MDFVTEIQGLLTSNYEPKKKTLYVELHNRVFFLDKLDENCKYCGSKAYYKLNDYLNNFTKNTEMAKTETTAVKFELVDPSKGATVKLFDRFYTLDANTDQVTLQAAYNAGHTTYVKKVGE